MEESMIPLLPNDTFRFSCSESVSCFNECCRDLNQFLTPYDILRLKNGLGISSDIFLEKYTRQHTGPQTGLLVVTFKTDMALNFKCPFVTSKGCSVYKDRPSSCRTYPLVRLLSRSRDTGEVSEQYFLLKEAHCLGFHQEKIQTVSEWIESQEIRIYNEMNDMLMEIIALKNKLMPGSLDMKSSHLFYMACYDLDRFRKQVFETKIFDTLELDDNTWDTIKNDDTELLKQSLVWIKQVLFGFQF